MAIGWFVTGYALQTFQGMPGKGRYCMMNDFTTTIRADGGDWAESEILGGYAVVKVRASTTTLTTIAGTTGYYRMPAAIVNLTDALTSLTTAQRNAIQTRILAMGYTQAEIDTALGNTLALWRTHKLDDLLKFMAQRRLKARWDDVQKQIVLDGKLQACRPIAEVNAAVSNN